MIIRLAVVAHIYNSSYLRGKSKRIKRPRPAQVKSARPYFKKQKGWEYSPSG
jgi:hypothetical protein